MSKKEETYKIKGSEVVSKVKDLINEGNVTKITLKSKKGRVIAVFPLTVGVIGALLVPTLAAIGAITALLTDCTLTVEKDLKKR